MYLMLINGISQEFKLAMSGRSMHEQHRQRSYALRLTHNKKGCLINRQPSQTNINYNLQNAYSLLQLKLYVSLLLQF